MRFIEKIKTKFKGFSKKKIIAIAVIAILAIGGIVSGIIYGISHNEPKNIPAPRKDKKVQVDHDGNVTEDDRNSDNDENSVQRRENNQVDTTSKKSSSTSTTKESKKTEKSSASTPAKKSSSASSSSSSSSSSSTGSASSSHTPKKVWVVDRAAFTKQFPKYESREYYWCYYNGQYMETSYSQIQAWIGQGKPVDRWGNGTKNVLVGYETVTYPEKGHWEYQ